MTTATEEGQNVTATGEEQQNLNPDGDGIASGDDAGKAAAAAAGDDSSGGSPGIASEESAKEGAASGAPEAYAEFELPEGVKIDEAELEEMKAHFKEMGFTQEQAQKEITRQAQKFQASENAQRDAFQQIKKDWLGAAQTDTEIGGEAFEQSVSLARNAVKKYGTDGLNKFFRDSGIGNHPEIIRVFARIGKDLKEDQPSPAGAGVSVSAPKDRVSTLYGNKNEE